MDTLNGLKQFYEKITKYKKIIQRWNDNEYISDELSGNLQSVRTEIQRSYARLENTITRYGGTDFDRKIFHTAFDPTTYFYLEEKLNTLNKVIKVVNNIIGKLEAEGESWKVELSKKTEKETKQLSKEVSYKPKAFIAHGGKSEARDKLCQFLNALGITPIIVEEQPSEGRSVGENVDYYARQADCTIILATKGDINGKTGRFIPRGNVLIEIGKAQELFKDRIIYLLQAGVELPTDISEKVRARFTSEKMDDAFIKIAKELTKFGMLIAVKP